MMNFSQGAGQSTGNDLIPNGQLAWAILTVRAIKASQSGGQYLDIELTLEEGQPFGRRKIWDMIGDPMFSGNSEAYRQMGQVAIARILECGRGAGPNNPGGYVIQSYDQLNGLRVAIKIGVKKGTGGYDDKNNVAEYLTPNPASQSGHKGFQKLQAGEHNIAAAKPQPVPSGFQPAGAGFTQAQPQPAAPAVPSWGSHPAAPTVPATGFGAAAGGFGGAPAAPTNPAPSGWLAQANAQPGDLPDDPIPF